MSHLEDWEGDAIQIFEMSQKIWMDLQNEFKAKTNTNQVMTLNTLLALNNNGNDWIFYYMEKETI